MTTEPNTSMTSGDQSRVVPSGDMHPLSDRTRADRTARLAVLYADSDTHDQAVIAKVCDEALDRSGALLGNVRRLAWSERLRRRAAGGA